MSFTLEGITTDTETPVDTSFKTIDQQDDLLVWCHLVSSSLFNGKALDTDLIKAFAGNLWDPCLLTLHGTPVGTALIFKSPETAGIYMVTVDKKHRGLGIGKLLMKFCFRHLIGLGYKECVLQATREGYPLYLSLGFREEEKLSILYKIR
jgi:ribosomal protein S18 acetylase RimI-like enzyme